jgi:hypothetical protein
MPTAREHTTASTVILAVGGHGLTTCDTSIGNRAATVGSSALRAATVGPRAVRAATVAPRAVRAATVGPRAVRAAVPAASSPYSRASPTCASNPSASSPYSRTSPTCATNPTCAPRTSNGFIGAIGGLRRPELKRAEIRGCT